MSEGDFLDEWDPWEENWDPLLHFPLHPPPPPPGLDICSTDLECGLEDGPLGSRFDEARFPSLPVIAICSSIVFVAVLVACFLLWRHKSKVQNLLPCKNEQPGHLGDMGAANGMTYDDALMNHHATRIPQGPMDGSQTLMPLEILDVKLSDMGHPPPISGLHQVPYYPKRDVLQTIGGRPLHHHPVYEEMSQTSLVNKSTLDRPKLGTRSLRSEEDLVANFASPDYPSGEGSATSSIRGSTGGDLCKDPASSDDGTVDEPCEFVVDNIPQCSNVVGYPKRPNFNTERTRRHHHHPVQSPYGHHQHSTTSYPRPDRTANLLHSRSQAEVSSERGQQPSSFLTFIPPPHMRGIPNAQWLPPDRGYPVNASQENIYSTIDEDDVVDYPVHYRPIPSPAPRKTTTNKKSVRSSRGDNSISQLSQRAVQENGGLYGDDLPSAFM